VAKPTLERSAMISPRKSRDSKRPTKKRSIPANATATAIASRRRKGSWRINGEAIRTQTTPQYWRKIALAADVHFVASTNVVRHAA
jgi:hypothetical protein